MDLQLTDKVIMVAGASEGLGFGIATCLAAEGCHLSIASRSLDKITAATKKLQKNNSGKIIGSVMDAKNAESISAWIAHTVKEFGRIDGLVINTGGPPAGNFAQLTDEHWQQGFELILMSAVHMIRGVLPYLQQQPHSAILAVTSYLIKEPDPILTLSNAFRSGLVALLKSLSRELAPQGVRVNNLIPGKMDTDRIKDLNQIIANKEKVDIESIKQQQFASIPLGRYGTPEEFGRAATFLLSPAASYITGETLIVDGGLVKTVW